MWKGAGLDITNFEFVIVTFSPDGKTLALSRYDANLQDNLLLVDTLSDQHRRPRRGQMSPHYHLLDILDGLYDS